MHHVTHARAVNHLPNREGVARGTSDPAAIEQADGLLASQHLDPSIQRAAVGLQPRVHTQQASDGYG